MVRVSNNNNNNNNIKKINIFTEEDIEDVHELVLSEL